MSSTTENLGLTLPAGSEWADVTVLNENWEKIDRQVLRAMAAAAAYDAGKTYQQGDYCTQGGLLYRANQAIAQPEAWTAGHWTAISITDVIRGLTAEDVGARPDDWMPTAADVGARPDDWTPTAEDVGAVSADKLGKPGGVATLGPDGKLPADQTSAAGLLPQLLVTTEAGVTVTATLGDTTVTATAGEDGTAVLDLPEYGTWAVMVDANGYVLEQTVTVDTVKQYDVNLRVQVINYTMLFDNGDTCDDVTGGWDGTLTNLTVTANKGTLSQSIACGASHYGFFRSYRVTTKPIDMSDYNGIFQCHTGSSNYESQYKRYGTLYTRIMASLSDDQDAVFTFTTGGSTGSLTVPKLSYYGFNNPGTRYVDTGTRHDWVTYDYNARHTTYAIGLTKADDWQAVATEAGITASTISDVVDNPDNCATLLANQSAVTRMIYTCTGDFMASAVASSTFLEALNASPYKELISGNPHWGKFLAMVA